MTVAMMKFSWTQHLLAWVMKYLRKSEQHWVENRYEFYWNVVQPLFYYWK
jgi:hypothetical protein